MMGVQCSLPHCCVASPSPAIYHLSSIICHLSSLCLLPVASAKAWFLQALSVLSSHAHITWCEMDGTVRNEDVPLPPLSLEDLRAGAYALHLTSYIVHCLARKTAPSNPQHAYSIRSLYHVPCIINMISRHSAKLHISHDMAYDI